jgi:hypothetical protein
MSGPNWKLENSETLTITFPSTPPAAIQWKAPMVDEHLQKLGKLRAGMRPGTQCLGVHFYTSGIPVSGGCII